MRTKWYVTVTFPTGEAHRWTRSHTNPWTGAYQVVVYGTFERNDEIVAVRDCVKDGYTVKVERMP